VLTTEDADFTLAPRPATIEAAGGGARVTFQRAGAVVLRAL
jgi:hypothetical protein